MRTDVQCLHRWNKVLKPGLHKGPWKEEEDNIVRETVMRHGVGKVKWSSIAALVSKNSNSFIILLVLIPLKPFDNLLCNYCMLYPRNEM